MKTQTIFVAILLLVGTACSPGTEHLEPTDQPTAETEPPTATHRPPPTKAASESEKRCGDGVCDGPENTHNCPEDCRPAASPTPGRSPTPVQASEVTPSEDAEKHTDHIILYHVVEHTVSSREMNDATCYTFNFRQFLDAGHVRPDGGNNQILELKDHPTSKITAREGDRFYYISSPHNPIVETFGMAMFDWDVEDQTLWSSGFTDTSPTEVAASDGAEFPGGVTTAPENASLLYLITQRSEPSSAEAGGLLAGKFNPFTSDSSLMVTAPDGGEAAPVLSGNYNRQLFASFADFSAGGEYFYTLVKDGDGFGLVRLALASRRAVSFEEVFPSFNWDAVPWDELFPRANDFSYASFTIAPDETRLIAYKNNFSANLENPCFSEARHDLWVFDIEQDRTERYENRPGYVTDSAWKPDASELALAIVGNSGCYPDYLDAWIDTVDREGEKIATLVQEPKSKITTIGWSSDGESIAYDVYGTDFVGRLKVIDVRENEVREIVSTQDLGHEVDRSRPVTLLFANWISEP